MSKTKTDRTKNLNLKESEINRILQADIPDALYKKLKGVLEKKRITVASGKAKGRNLQQFVCKEISDSTGHPYNQQDDDCLIHSREMGQAGKDIVLRGEVKDLWPFSFECKNVENLNLVNTIQQAQENSSPEYPAVIVHKRKAYTEPMVYIPWALFRSLVEKGNQ